MSPVSYDMIITDDVAFESRGNGKAIAMLDEVKESIINAYELKTGLSRAKLARLMKKRVVQCKKR